jgi:hypothetical protein
MREVIEAIDGAICLNVCLMHGRSCPRKARCPAHPVWVRAQQAMLQVLSNRFDRRLGGAGIAGRSANGVRRLSGPRERSVADRALSNLPSAPAECFNRIIETGVLHELWG